MDISIKNQSYGSALIICFPGGQPPGHPWEPKGNCTVLVFLFFSQMRGVFLVLETTKYGYVPVLDHRDVAIRFVLVLVAVISLKTKVSLAILFHSMPNFDVIVYTSL